MNPGGYLFKVKHATKYIDIIRMTNTMIDDIKYVKLSKWRSIRIQNHLNQFLSIIYVIIFSNLIGESKILRLFFF